MNWTRHELGWIDNTTGLLWHFARRNKLNLEEAKAWAEEQGGRLPTRDEFKVAEKNDVRKLDGLDWNNWFWSSTSNAYYYAYVFDGDNGYTDGYDYRDYRGTHVFARCISEIKNKQPEAESKIYTPCWIYPNKPATNGYVRAYVEGKTYLAHRRSYECFVGSLIDGSEIDHLCKNKACVRPDHLEQVTPAENKRRSDCPSGVNFKKTQCARGHAFDGVGYDNGKQRRVCKTCKRANDLASRKKRELDNKK